MSAEEQQSAPPPSGGEMVVFGATGRRLLFEPEELVLPERLANGPRGAWYAKQWEQIKPTWMEWVRRDERGLMNLSVDQLIEQMANSLEGRASGKNNSKKKHHQRKHTAALDGQVKAAVAGTWTFSPTETKTVLLTGFCTAEMYVSMSSSDREALVRDLVANGVRKTIVENNDGSMAAVENVKERVFTSLCVSDRISAAEWEAKDEERKKQQAAGTDASALDQEDPHSKAGEDEGDEADDGELAKKTARKENNNSRKKYLASHEIDVAGGTVAVFVSDIPSVKDVTAVCEKLHGRVFAGCNVVCVPFSTFVDRKKGSNGGDATADDGDRGGDAQKQVE